VTHAVPGNKSETREVKAWRHFELVRSRVRFRTSLLTSRAMDDTVNQYRVWSDKLSAEGPMELPALVSAIKGKRVKAESWVYLDHERRWLRASEVTELKMFFRSPAAAPGASPLSSAAPQGAQPAVKPGSLRRIKVLADFDEAQLETFVKFMEVIPVKPFATVVKAGDHGDAMYLVLEGELRARNLIDGRETTLATMRVGEFFDEISLMDHGPRSADVIANEPSVLLKISAASVERLVQESPALAAPFLYAVSRAIVGRLRGVSKKYQDSVHFSRLAGAVS